MALKVLVLCAVVAGAVAVYGPEPSYPEAPPKYDFAYAVRDDSSGNDFGHRETRDGSTTTGQYRVVLPDGRVQVVTYTADQHGYQAHLLYEGLANYPEYRPVQHKPAPASYKPAPASYRPAPLSYKPAPASYKPVPASYKPAPASYKPAPASYKPAPASYKPAPYKRTGHLPHRALYHPRPASYLPYPGGTTAKESQE